MDQVLELAVAALAASSTVQPAAADSGATRPEPVRVEVEVPDGMTRLHKSTLDNVGEGLARHGWSPTDTTEGGLLMRVQVEVEADTHRIRLELLDETGEVVSRASTRCEICGLSEVGELVADRSAAVVAQFEADREAAPILRIEAAPKGATIRIDGVEYGVVPIELELPPGEHVVQLDAPGFVGQSRTVDLIPGIERSLVVQLSREAPMHTAPPPPSGRGQIIAGSVVALAGLAAAAAGAGLLEIDGTPIQRNCRPDPLGNCARIHDTFAPGAASVGLGAAAAIAGAVVFGLGLKRKHASARVSAGPTGIRGRF